MTQTHPRPTVDLHESKGLHIFVHDDTQTSYERVSGNWFRQITIGRTASALEIHISFDGEPIPTESQHPLIALFRKWDSAPDTQTEKDWAQLKVRLDKNRTSKRRLFPNANDPS